MPTLVVNATFDPSTPYEGAVNLAAQIKGSDLLTPVGDGHTSYYTSACARRVEDRFLGPSARIGESDLPRLTSPPHRLATAVVSTSDATAGGRPTHHS